MSKLSQLFGGGSSAGNTAIAAPAATTAPPSFYAPKSPYSGASALKDSAIMAAALNNTIMTSSQGVKEAPLLAKQGLKALLGQ